MNPGHERSPEEASTPRGRPEKALLGSVVDEPGCIVVQPSIPPTIKIQNAAYSMVRCDIFSLTQGRRWWCASMLISLLARNVLTDYHRTGFSHSTEAVPLRYGEQRSAKQRKHQALFAISRKCEGIWTTNDAGKDSWGQPEGRPTRRRGDSPSHASLVARICCTSCGRWQMARSNFCPVLLRESRHSLDELIHLECSSIVDRYRKPGTVSTWLDAPAYQLAIVT